MSLFQNENQLFKIKIAASSLAKKQQPQQHLVHASLADM